MTVSVFILPLLWIALALSVIMAGAWLVQRWTGNSGWVDTVWTFGVGTVGIATALWALPGETQMTTRQIVVAVLAGLWALRLGVYIAMRTAAIKDDPRYARLAADWGEAAPRRMFYFLQQQAFGSAPLAFAIFIAAHRPGAALRIADILGFAILIVAVFGEAIADDQLRRFRADPANKFSIIDSGLWAWSRHPNYFFQWFGWLAYPVIAIDFTGNYPWGWLTLLGPVVMYWVLRYATGVPHLERHMLRTRGEAFRAYQKRTSLFFPWPPTSA